MERNDRDYVRDFADFPGRCLLRLHADGLERGATRAWVRTPLVMSTKFPVPMAPVVSNPAMPDSASTGLRHSAIPTRSFPTSGTILSPSTSRISTGPRAATTSGWGFDIYRLALNHTQPEFPSARQLQCRGPLQLQPGSDTAIDGERQWSVSTSAGSQYNAMAAYLLGLVTDGGRLLQVPDEYTTRTGMYSFYIRDQWQATRNLTINYGTRYEYFPLPTRTDRGMERYNFDTNQMLVCGIGNVPKDCGTKVGKVYFSPRLGIAYRANEKTVVRSGFGINWDPWNLARPLRTNYPVLWLRKTSPLLRRSAGRRRCRRVCPWFRCRILGNGIIPVPGNYAVTTTDDQYTRGYILNWNFTIERQLPGKFVGQVGYVANRAVHTPSVLDLNAGQVLGADRAGQPLFAKFGRSAGTSLVEGTRYSTYHSLQAQLNRRFSGGFQLGTAYTWSKVIGMCCEEENNAGPRIKALNYLDLNRTVLNSDRHSQLADQRDL